MRNRWTAVTNRGIRAKEDWGGLNTFWGSGYVGEEASLAGRKSQVPLPHAESQLAFGLKAAEVSGQVKPCEEGYHHSVSTPSRRKSWRQITSGWDRVRRSFLLCAMAGEENVEEAPVVNAKAITRTGSP